MELSDKEVRIVGFCVRDARLRHFDTLRNQPDVTELQARLDAEMLRIVRSEKPCADCGLTGGKHHDGCIYEEVSLGGR